MTFSVMFAVFQSVSTVTGSKRLERAMSDKAGVQRARMNIKKKRSRGNSNIVMSKFRHVLPHG